MRGAVFALLAMLALPFHVLIRSDVERWTALAKGLRLEPQ